MANAFGIMCESNGNVIGGIQNGSVQYGNVISGNLIGLEFYGSASFNLVAGNYVGPARMAMPPTPTAIMVFMITPQPVRQSVRHRRCGRLQCDRGQRRCGPLSGGE